MISGKIEMLEKTRKKWCFLEKAFLLETNTITIETLGLFFTTKNTNNLNSVITVLRID